MAKKTKKILTIVFKENKGFDLEISGLSTIESIALLDCAKKNLLNQVLNSNTLNHEQESNS